MTEFNFSRNQQLALLALVGLTLLGLSYGRIKSARPAIVQESSATVSEPAPRGGVDVLAPSERTYRLKDEYPSVTVHVAGSVKNPGLRKLQSGSRVADAIQAAGGPTTDADLDAINLAARVRDGEKIAVPSKQAAAPPPPPPTFAGAPAARTYSPTPATTAPASGIVNINTAGIDELDRLPGVGPATAQKIIDYRNQIGRFSSIEQLMDVKGIGPKKLEQMRPFVGL